MKREVLYSPAAVRDLERVRNDVLEASGLGETASKYVGDLMDRVEAKADYPESGAPLYYENSSTGYRFVVFKEYIAFYRTQDGRIFVDRVLYRASDYMRKLGPPSGPEDPEDGKE